MMVSIIINFKNKKILNIYRFIFNLIFIIIPAILSFLIIISIHTVYFLYLDGDGLFCFDKLSGVQEENFDRYYINNPFLDLPDYNKMDISAIINLEP
jgi:hypothetical protein